MRARQSSASLTGMNSRRTLIACVAAAALLPATQAQADPSPPIPDGVKCHIAVKRTLGLGKVLRRGVPVKVTCDGPAKILVMPDFDPSSAASIEVAETYGSHYPVIAHAKKAKLTGAGTITLRPRFTKPAKKILRHHAKTKINVALGTMREDGHYWSDPGDWAYTTLER